MYSPLEDVFQPWPRPLDLLLSDLQNKKTDRWNCGYQSPLKEHWT